jgi:CRP-like cAMP-binding protein
MRQIVARSDDDLSPLRGPTPANLLLAALPEQDRLAPFLTRLELPQDGTLYEYDAPLTHYVFPTQGILSLVKEMPGATVEVGTVGREGMVAISALLGVRLATTRIFAQADLIAYRIAVDDLDAVVERSPGTRHILMRYTHAFHEEVAQSVACNRLHTLEERCARWLLLTHDRTGTEVMQLKQRFLSYMLGVHRPAVSLAAGALQRAGIIRYSRGRITILDRGALEEASCECYELNRNAYAKARLPIPTVQSA